MPVSMEVLSLKRYANIPLSTFNLNMVISFSLSAFVFLQVLSNDNVKFGYNAATGKYEDLMSVGIIDPTKVTCFYYYHCDYMSCNSLFDGLII